MKIKDNVYEISPEIHKALCSTRYTGKTIKSENDTLMMNKFFLYAGIRDRTTNRKTFFTIELPRRVNEIESKAFNEIDLEGQGLKIIIPSNIIDIYTRLEVLLG